MNRYDSKIESFKEFIYLVDRETRKGFNKNEKVPIDEVTRRRYALRVDSPTNFFLITNIYYSALKNLKLN